MHKIIKNIIVKLKTLIKPTTKSSIQKKETKKELPETHYPMW